jgi:hypothetical protein
MPIRPFLAGQAFEPEVIREMSVALENVCKALGLALNDDANTRLVIRENIAALKKKGKSKDEIVAAKPGAAFDAKWGGGPIDPGFFTRLVYEGV